MTTTPTSLHSQLSELPDQFQGLRASYEAIHSVGELNTLEDLEKIRVVLDKLPYILMDRQNKAITLKLASLKMHLQFTKELVVGETEEDYFI